LQRGGQLFSRGKRFNGRQWSSGKRLEGQLSPGARILGPAVISGILRAPRPQLTVRPLWRGRGRRPAVHGTPAEVVGGVIITPAISGPRDRVIVTWFPVSDTRFNMVQQIKVFPH